MNLRWGWHVFFWTLLGCYTCFLCIGSNKYVIMIPLCDFSLRLGIKQKPWNKATKPPKSKEINMDVPKKKLGQQIGDPTKTGLGSSTSTGRWKAHDQIHRSPKQIQHWMGWCNWSWKVTQATWRNNSKGIIYLNPQHLELKDLKRAFDVGSQGLPSSYDLFKLFLWFVTILYIYIIIQQPGFSLICVGSL